jgi:hypothetical protein
MGPRNSNWHSLEKGDVVDLFDQNVVIASGRVDDFTEDREVLWLIPSFSTGRSGLHRTYGGGRRMFHRSDGWEVGTSLPLQ